MTFASPEHAPETGLNVMKGLRADRVSIVLVISHEEFPLAMQEKLPKDGA